MSNATRTYLNVIIIVIVMAFGCSPVGVPLKGKYVDSPVVFTSTMPVDSIWRNLTNLFIEKGLLIVNIEKKKGKILTRKSALNSIYTFEDQDGHLLEAAAWVVLTKVVNKEKEWKPGEIQGEWSIQVYETEKGGTTIKVDPTVISTYFPNTFTKMETRGHSTGKLEELIKQLVNNN